MAGSSLGAVWLELLPNYRLEWVWLCFDAQCFGMNHYFHCLEWGICLSDSVPQRFVYTHTCPVCFLFGFVWFSVLPVSGGSVPRQIRGFFFMLCGCRRMAVRPEMTCLLHLWSFVWLISWPGPILIWVKPLFSEGIPLSAKKWSWIGTFPRNLDEPIHFISRCMLMIFTTEYLWQSKGMNQSSGLWWFESKHFKFPLGFLLLR